MTFDQLNLTEDILSALRDLNYVEPTPIQQKAIPPALDGRDVLGCAQTGTGKTAAFALPILQKISKEQGKGVIRALILTPTRELALQIHQSFCDYGKNLETKSVVIFGGVSQVNQVKELEGGADILVATPGRLIDLMNQKLVELSKVDFFVLDEADRMLDMGFIQDVERIVSAVPTNRQTMLFSATMPNEIMGLAKKLLSDPVKAQAAPPATTAELVKQKVYYTDKLKKRELLVWVIRNLNIYSAIVFTRTKHGADKVAKALNGAKISAMSIHGDKSQSARQFAMSNFKSGRVQVLVATDIAARGIDIEQLSHVINFDIPNEPETYVHRIGRTGRAGAEGTAISFCCFDELDFLKDIEKLIKQKIEVELENPYPMQVHQAQPKFQPPKRENKAKQAKKNSESKEIKLSEKEIAEIKQAVKKKERYFKNKDKNADLANRSPKKSADKKSGSFKPKSKRPAKKAND